MRAECSMAKLIAAEKVRAGYSTACNSMPELDGKNQGEEAQSKRVRDGSLAIVDKPQPAGT